MISSSVIEFLLITGVPPGGWVGGLGGGVCGCPMHHAHACTHMHMHVKHDKHGCLYVGGHLQFLYMYTHASMHAHAWACVWGQPHMPPDAPHQPAPSPEPQGAQNTKNSISLELIKIF